MLDTEIGCARSDLPSARPRDSLHPHLVLLLGAVVSCAANYCQDTKALDTCLENIFTILKNDRMSGLPVTKEEVDFMCRTFKNGMKCVDSFFVSCRIPSERAFLEQAILGAKFTMEYLCDNENFQKEYLVHAKCYKRISKDFATCQHRMKQIVAEHFNSNQHSRKPDKTGTIKNICCAKYEFLTCTERVSSQSCDKEATAFMHKIAETLSNHALNGYCRDVTESPCKTMSTASARSPSHRPRPWSALILLLCLSIYLFTT